MSLPKCLTHTSSSMIVQTGRAFHPAVGVQPCSNPNGIASSCASLDQRSGQCCQRQGCPRLRTGQSQLWDTPVQPRCDDFERSKQHTLGGCYLGSESLKQAVHSTLQDLTLRPPSFHLPTIQLLCNACKMLTKNTNLDVFRPHKTTGTLRDAHLSHKLFSPSNEPSSKSMV